MDRRPPSREGLAGVTLVAATIWAKICAHTSQANDWPSGKGVELACRCHGSIPNHHISCLQFYLCMLMFGIL